MMFYSNGAPPFYYPPPPQQENLSPKKMARMWHKIWKAEELEKKKKEDEEKNKKNAPKPSALISIMETFAILSMFGPVVGLLNILITSWALQLFINAMPILTK